LPHNLSRFEFNRSSRGDFEAAAWLIGITADSFPRQAHFEDPKIPELDVFSPGQVIRDQIERPLDYFENLVLDHSGIVTNPYNDLPFR
jgi:hypothetical protein